MRPRQLSNRAKVVQKSEPNSRLGQTANPLETEQRSETGFHTYLYGCHLLQEH